MVAATGAGNTAPELLAEAERAMASGIPIVMVSRAPSGPAGTGYAFPGGGATWARAGAMLAGTLTAPKARIALAVGLGAGLGGQDLARFLAGPDAARPQSPDAGVRGRRTVRRRWPDRGGPMTPAAELIVEGRIATLAGDAGFGWVEAIAIAGGRVVAAGSVADVDATAGRGTRRLRLAPSEVAVPGLTDAHLHLAQGAMSARHVDLSTATSLEEGLRRIAEAHQGLAPDAWLQGHGWESDRWGGWPTAADLERVAPDRPVALWAHDHHSLWASATALRLAGVGPGTPDPDGGEIRRGVDGVPTGVLHEAAAGLVAGRVPAPTADELAAAIPDLAGQLVALGVVAVHDPGDLVPDPDPGRCVRGVRPPVRCRPPAGPGPRLAPCRGGLGRR